MQRKTSRKPRDEGSHRTPQLWLSVGSPLACCGEVPREGEGVAAAGPPGPGGGQLPPAHPPAVASGGICLDTKALRSGRSNET